MRSGFQKYPHGIKTRENPRRASQHPAGDIRFGDGGDEVDRFVEVPGNGHFPFCSRSAYCAFVPVADHQSDCSATSRQSSSTISAHEFAKTFGVAGFQSRESRLRAMHLQEPFALAVGIEGLSSPAPACSHSSISSRQSRPSSVAYSMPPER